mmetsp:Transcript_34542/g.101513  ORF Transcript_34542/g.101513 Transcript_34542/m.101513 type:complete len:945 (-) Transcript_34542:93-2927(-)
MGLHMAGLRSLLHRGRRAALAASASSTSETFSAGGFSTHLPPLALATAAVATGGVVIASSDLNLEDSSADVRHVSDNAGRAREHISLAGPSPSASLPIMSAPQILATSSSTSNISTADTQPKSYDFIVVGNGNAGQSAVRTLSELCPNASVAIIDPKAPSQGNSNDTKTTASATYIGQAVTGLDHNKRTLKLTDGSTLNFRQSVLIATGCRGAPPPSSLIDERAQSRILELRSTEAFISSSVDNENDHHRAQQRRPVMNPEGVRQMTYMAASQGARVCVMGSGVEALELAATAAAASPDITRSGKRRKRKGNKNGNGDSAGGDISSNDDAKVTLLFGGAGMLSKRLPRYLSNAVAKRFKSAGIDVQSRSLVRYVAMHNYHGVEECEVHTAKSFDTMDTRRTRVDLLVLAPSVGGPRGTAVLNCRDGAPSSLLLPSIFASWSRMSSGSINCYVDDGRIAVNSELNAASRIYAAGSVAKFPSCDTGHAAVAGEGTTNASLAGRVAAHNMVRDYCERTPSRPFGRAKEIEALQSSRLFSVESCPIWRTDVGAFGGTDGPSSSSLSALGINALCVGNCDSETMATHGFFWTNQASDSRRRNTLARSSAEKKSDESVDETSGGVSKGVLTRRRSTKRSSTMRRSVYGSGVVFYLDRTGAIRGMMTWGLPFTKGDKDIGDDTSINPHLLSRMHEIIRTNGEILKPHHEKAVFERDSRLDLRMLSSLHLSEESKYLASIALSSVPGDHTFNTITAQPLHRYIPSKPASMTSIGMLKRRDEIGTGGVGEDLFARTPSTECSEDERPPSLVHVYPMQFGSRPDPSAFWTGGTVANSNDSLVAAESSSKPAIADMGATKKAWKVDGIRSRPAKEEPLWLREGDAASKISMNDVLTDVFLMQVRRGRFSDGSDSVKQAPTPKMIENAKALLFGSENDDDVEGEEYDDEGENDGGR